ncbi:50S ribosomal protein L29 [Marinilabiliaceae bacterium JC017]|nr:50S ribosomal protein L29 [Marinilabiliaceae bacterium JC017]
MKTTEIRELTVSEIEERIDAENGQLNSLEINHSVSPLENPMKIRQTRRNIARLKTILSQKQLNEK